MDDERIIDLYWERSEAAIGETQKKFGKYCHYIAFHILRDDQDAEECVNDAYMGAWNAMPPQRPARLQQFLGAITRNIALNRFDYRRAGKRCAETKAIADEFWDCVPDGREPVDDALAFREVVNQFLSSLDARTRIIFMRRYWYLCSVKEIAEGMDLSEVNVKVTLHRTRNKFRICLEKEGFFV